MVSAMWRFCRQSGLLAARGDSLGVRGDLLGAAPWAGSTASTEQRPEGRGRLAVGQDVAAGGLVQGEVPAGGRERRGHGGGRPAQSSGRKAGVGWPLARMLLLVPWCRLRYQPVAGSGVVTPVTVLTSCMIWPPLSAVKSISMYWTGPWLMQLPMWMCAACAPGVRPLAVRVTVMVLAPGL